MISDALNEKLSVCVTLLLTQHCSGCLMCMMKEWRCDDEGMNKWSPLNFLHSLHRQHHAPGHQLLLGTIPGLKGNEFRGYSSFNKNKANSTLTPSETFFIIFNLEKWP